MATIALESTSDMHATKPASSPLAPLAAEGTVESAAMWRLLVQLMQRLISRPSHDAEHAQLQRQLGDRLWQRLSAMLLPSLLTWRGKTTAVRR